MTLEDMFSLKGRIALVTGGSRGIGKMIVEGFLAAGIERVYISARKIHEIEETCAELGDKVIGIQGDISTMTGIDALVEEISSRESHLDILVNNAGAAWGADYLDFPEAGWDKVMDLNVKSPFFLTQKLHKLLTANASQAKPGKVINIASVDGLRINPWETYSYQASKAALIHLTRRMAARLVKDHVYVTAIAPGARLHDNHLRTLVGRVVALGVAQQRQRAIGAPERTLTVGHDREVGTRTVHPLRRAQFG